MKRNIMGLESKYYIFEKWQLIPLHYILLSCSNAALTIKKSQKIMISPPQRQVKWSELGVKKSGEYDDLRIPFSCLVMSESFRQHKPQHARPPCPSPTAAIYPKPCPLSWWCHPTISSSVVPFSSCLQSFPASESFQMSQLFTSGGQSIEVSASTSVLPMNTQDWSLEWTGWISLQSKGLSRVFSNTTVQKHQFFSSQVFL